MISKEFETNQVAIQLSILVNLVKTSPSIQPAIYITCLFVYLFT